MPKVDLSAFKPTRLTMSEREISSSEAFVRINNVIQTLGLKARVRYVDDGNLVATAELYNEYDTLIESGAGKGPDALVGALAESLEHYAMFHAEPPFCTTLGCSDIASQNGVESDGIFTSLRKNIEPLQCLQHSTAAPGFLCHAPCCIRSKMNVKQRVNRRAF